MVTPLQLLLWAQWLAVGAAWPSCEIESGASRTLEGNLEIEMLGVATSYGCMQIICKACGQTCSSCPLCIAQTQFYTKRDSGYQQSNTVRH